MTLPQPTYLSILQASTDEKIPADVIHWFIDVGELDIYVAIKSDFRICSKEINTASHIARITDIEKWSQKPDSRLLVIKQLEILNQESKTINFINISQLCVYDDILISMVELSNLVSRFNNKRSAYSRPAFLFEDFQSGGNEFLLGKKDIPKDINVAEDIKINSNIQLPDPEFITLQEAAEILNKPFGRVKWYVEEGHLNVYVPTPKAYIDVELYTDHYARAKDLMLYFNTGNSGVLGYNQLEIINKSGVTYNVVSSPHSCVIIQDVKLSTKEITALGKSQIYKEQLRTGKPDMLKIKEYVEVLKAKGLTKKEIAVQLKTEIPSLTPSCIGRLLPARPEKGVIGKEGYRQQGRRLLGLIK